MSSRRDTWSHAAFRIFSGSLTAAKISDALGLMPTRSHEAGDPVEGDPDAPPRPTALWYLASGIDEHEPMEPHLIALLEALEPQIDGLRRLAAECRMGFFCTYT